MFLFSLSLRVYSVLFYEKLWPAACVMSSVRTMHQCSRLHVAWAYVLKLCLHFSLVISSLDQGIPSSLFCVVRNWNACLHSENYLAVSLHK